MKYFFLGALLLLISCGKQEEVPGAAGKDSLLATPLHDEIDTMHPIPDSNGLVVDSFTIRQNKDAATLKRFQPKEVLDIYESYWPLRSVHTTQHQVDSFIIARKITAAELHAVLAQGDRLGWATAHQH
jgi:hypothetical protein